MPVSGRHNVYYNLGLIQISVFGVLAMYCHSIQIPGQCLSQRTCTCSVKNMFSFCPLTNASSLCCHFWLLHQGLRHFWLLHQVLDLLSQIIAETAEIQLVVVGTLDNTEYCIV